jgi:hypothetical protein
MNFTSGPKVLSSSFGPSFLGSEPSLLDRRWLLVVEERALLLNLPR